MEQEDLVGKDVPTGAAPPVDPPAQDQPRQAEGNTDSTAPPDDSPPDKNAAPLDDSSVATALVGNLLADPNKKKKKKKRILSHQHLSKRFFPHANTWRGIHYA